jgi:hypothetical protein
MVSLRGVGMAQCCAGPPVNLKGGEAPVAVTICARITLLLAHPGAIDADARSAFRSGRRMVAVLCRRARGRLTDAKAVPILDWIGQK